MSQDVQFKQQLEALKNQGGDVDADAEHEPETARQASNAGLRREAAVQRKGGGESGGDVQNAAARGVQGSGGQLPHMDAIQRSFGEHDVSGIQAHTGGQAGEASREMGAEAYATGNNVAFAGAPDLHTAAHEAAHVVQQRQGVQLKSKVGGAGDSYEKQADEVADRVVAGKPAGDLLGDAKASAAPAEAGPVQMKGGPKEKKEEHVVTPAERDAESHESDKDTTAAMSKSILLLTKHMHAALHTFHTQRNVNPGAHTNANVDVTIQAFNEVFDETARLGSLLGGVHLSAKNKGYLFDPMTKLAGARFMLVNELGPVDTFAGGAIKAPGERFKERIGAIFESAGFDLIKDQQSRSEPSADEPKMQDEAIRAHIEAAREAAVSAAMDIPQVDRLNAHVKEIYDLTPSVPHALRPYKDEIKALNDVVTQLEKSHPDAVTSLKQTHGLLKQMISLSK